MSVQETPEWTGGHLAGNVMHFVRLLRRSGLALGPDKAITAVDALQKVGIERRDDFRSALAAVLVQRREQQAVFDHAFDLFWRDPRLRQRGLNESLPKVKGKLETPSRAAAGRVEQALAHPRKGAEAPQADAVEFDAAFSVSSSERLQTRDFEAMTLDELAAVKAMMARLRLPLPAIRTRRTRASARGRIVDLRASLRAMSASRRDLLPLLWRERKRRHPPLVVLCDISGSMERYSRMLLHFVHALSNDRDRVHVLLFGTRLTSVTRQLKERDVDVALDRVTDSVPDWSGGTRIGASLSEFNRRWSRRLLGQGATVLLISDGLESDVDDRLAQAMERLSKSCRRLVWLNPLLRYDGFEARPAGIRAMLPYVDDFLPVHNLQSLEQLAQSLGRPASSRGRAAGRDPGTRRQPREAPGMMRCK